MRQGGVPNVPSTDDVLQDAINVATQMQNDVHSYYNLCSDPSKAAHRWHQKCPDGSRPVRSGTVIQEDVLTDPRLYKGGERYLWLYEHCVLKTSNEAVVESMCKMISIHANTQRGLSFGHYAKEAIIMWNAPAAHEAESLLREALDDYFGKNAHGVQKPWHFFSIDKANRALTTIVSRVIDKLKKLKSKFPHVANPVTDREG